MYLSSRCSFDDVTRINFWFQLLATWSSPLAVLHLPANFDAVKIYIYMQSGVIDIFPKFKLATAAILDFQVKWIWHIHWHRRTHASDVYFMTSRELISGFDFRSRGTSPHGRAASAHRRWCKDLYPVCSYWHFAEIRDGGHLRRLTRDGA